MNSMVLITVLALGAPTLKEKPRTDSIVGEWMEIKRENEQKEVATLGEWILSEDGKLNFRREGKLEVVRPYLYSVDFTSTPITFDIRLPNDDDPLMFRGILKFDGEKLIICLAEIEKPRPTEFATKIGSKESLLVFERIKPKK